MDKQKVNLLESSGLLSKGKRYLVVSRKYPSASQVFIGVIAFDHGTA